MYNFTRTISEQTGGKIGRLQIARLVHVADDAFDGDVADCLAEKELLDSRWSDGTQGRQEEQKAAEAERLVGVGRRDVAAERQLGLILQVDSRRNVA